MPRAYYCSPSKLSASTLRHILESHQGLEILHETVLFPETVGTLESRAQQRAHIARRYMLSFAHPPAYFVVVSDISFAGAEPVPLEKLDKPAQSESNCTIRTALAYADPASSLFVDRPFISAVNGMYLPTPRGPAKEYQGPLARHFIPSGRDVSLAELSREDYLFWVRTNSEYAHEFARWILDPTRDSHLKTPLARKRR